MPRKPSLLPSHAPVHVLGNGRLHRAIVDLPERMAEEDRPLQSRVVFFEAPAGAHPSDHLVKVLAATWCMDTEDLAGRGFIRNVSSATELLDADEFGAPGDLGLFVTGSGGYTQPAIGSERLHYARLRDVDLFTTPRVSARLHELLMAIEGLYEAAPMQPRG